MTKKSFILFYIICGLIGIVLIQAIYLSNTKSITQELLNKKQTFVKVVGLPDLAICTEASYIRHRSLSDMFSIYTDDGVLREYFPSSFTYNHSTIINNKENANDQK